MVVPQRYFHDLRDRDDLHVAVVNLLSCPAMQDAVVLKPENCAIRGDSIYGSLVHKPVIVANLHLQALRERSSRQQAASLRPTPSQDRLHLAPDERGRNTG